MRVGTWKMKPRKQIDSTKMETLQEILEQSKVIELREYWKPLNEYYNPSLGLNNDITALQKYQKWHRESFKKCFADKWGVEDIYNNNNFYLILIIENEKVVQVGFTGCLLSWFSHYVEYGYEKLRMYVKDLTAENITYDNFRQYKKQYIEKFINV